ncbi:hypothetical protein C5L14_27545 [Labrys okinawensis]|uniref:DUF2946 domain-containing protein n=1 Tax=Labrys okinawensis TaxID=346911 RepID=A0A2S9Q4Q3_9HYPH|nr:hypothetical protein [Labrys okinawensis]PRH84300.1 hypothetical protein C5L14_27545 [Labrys okinawensis]
MIRLFRPFLCLMLALLFAVTTVGWAMASTRMAGDLATSHHAAGKKADAPHHDQATMTGEMSCHPPAPCSDEDGAGEAASTCCAFACHVAVETDAPLLNARTFIIAIKLAFMEPGLPMAMLSLLDRPPRRADASAG